MRLKRLISTTVAICSISLSLGVASEQVLTVPGAVRLFGLSAAPSGNNLLLFASSEKADGEESRGRALLVQQKAGQFVVERLRVPESTDDFSIPVWDPRGHVAYFLTAKGLFAVEIASPTARLVFPGTLAGLAISPDGSYLAFWNFSSDEPSSYALTVLDTKSFKVARNWNVKVVFAGDQYGYEIAFLNKAQGLVAKTYENELLTPLRFFDLSTGETHTIADNISGLASSQDSVFAVTQTEERTALMKIDTSLRLDEVLSDFHYDQILSSGTKNQLIAQNGKTQEFAVFDVNSKKLMRLSSNCDAAVVMADGQILMTQANKSIDASATQK